MTPLDLAELLLAKADQDATAVSKFQADPEIADEIIGFHCQQAVEKLLKALLAAEAVPYRRTHDLKELAALLAGQGLTLPLPEAELSRLMPYAAQLRYELGTPLVPLDRAAALGTVRRVRAWVEGELEKRRAAQNPSAPSSPQTP